MNGEVKNDSIGLLNRVLHQKIRISKRFFIFALVLILVLVWHVVIVLRLQQEVRALSSALEEEKKISDGLSSFLDEEEDEDEKEDDENKKRLDIVLAINTLLNKEAKAVATDESIVTVIEPRNPGAKCDDLTNPPTGVVSDSINVGPGAWGQVTLENGSYVLRFFTNSAATTPYPLLPAIEGNNCLFGELFTVYWVSADRIFVHYIGGHEVYPVTDAWFGSGTEWVSIYDFFDEKFPLLLDKYGTPLLPKITKNTFSLTETAYCCDVTTERYPGQWTEFIFDMKTLELVGAVLHSKDKSVE